MIGRVLRHGFPIGLRNKQDHVEVLVGPVCGQVPPQVEPALRLPIEVPTALRRHDLRDLRARLDNRVPAVQQSEPTREIGLDHNRGNRTLSAERGKWEVAHELIDCQL